MTERFKLVNELTEEIVGMYDAAEDYSEDKLYHGFDLASEANVTFIAREVFEGTIAMVIDELMTTEVGLEVLRRINAYRNL
jgi:transcriptional regulator NrdR family protein